MINYNIDGVGQKIRVNFNQDISLANSYTMTIQPESGSGYGYGLDSQSGNKQELVPALGTVDVVEGDKTFLANQYVEYAITAEQFKITGRWRVKATAVFTSSVLAADYVLFRVMP